MSEINKDSLATPGHRDIVQFADSHRVTLPQGEYKISIKQFVSENSNKRIPSKTWPAADHIFWILGERFQLDPNVVRSVYPPASAKGDYWTTLPHLVLERSTLPWERTATQPGPQSPPWLALLVFYEEEGSPLPAVRVVTKTNDQIGGDATVKANVISVPGSIIPKEADLNKLTHIRRRLAFIKNETKDGEGQAKVIFDTYDEALDYILPNLSNPVSYQMTSAAEKNLLPDTVDKDHAYIVKDQFTHESYEILKTKDEEEYKLYYVTHEAATVIANRLPKPGVRNQVHLVSLEGLLPIADATADVELVSLHQWSFFCETEQKSFLGLMEQLDKSDWVMSLPQANETGNKYLKEGFVPLKHFFRDGSRSISWYHGPLAPIGAQFDPHQYFADWESRDFHVRHSDELLQFDQKTGIFDTSYAVAWELGRTLTLQNTKIALAVYHWKRQHAQNLHHLHYLVMYGYPLVGTKSDPNQAPDETVINKWLSDLNLLKHIPFQYLVPDEALLPPESLRFFKIDKSWMDYLRDGVFSIGRVLNNDAATNSPDPATTQTDDDDNIYTGFLLRSEVVSGWPEMKMTAYSTVISATADPNNPSNTVKSPDRDSDTVLKPIRKELLAPQVMLVLFEGIIKTVDFFLPPETLHFGLDEPDTSISSDQPEKLVIRLRNPKDGASIVDAEVPMIGLINASDRLIDLSKLAPKIQATLKKKTNTQYEMNSNTLALQLTNGADLVRIKVKS